MKIIIIVITIQYSIILATREESQASKGPGTVCTCRFGPSLAQQGNLAVAHVLRQLATFFTLLRISRL